VSTVPRLKTTEAPRVGPAQIIMPVSTRMSKPILREMNIIASLLFPLAGSYQMEPRLIPSRQTRVPETERLLETFSPPFHSFLKA
jgi:hypothetical protein